MTAVSSASGKIGETETKLAVLASPSPLRGGIKGGGQRALAFERLLDDVEYASGVLANLVVPETQNSVPLGSHELVALAVIFEISIVDVGNAINLDDELRVAAGEVSEVWTNLSLTPEVIAC